MANNQEPCPPGQVRGSDGNCMPDPAGFKINKRLGESKDHESDGKRLRG